MEAPLDKYIRKSLEDYENVKKIYNSAAKGIPAQIVVDGKIITIAPSPEYDPDEYK